METGSGSACATLLRSLALETVSAGTTLLLQALDLFNTRSAIMAIGIGVCNIIGIPQTIDRANRALSPQEGTIGIIGLIGLIGNNNISQNHK